MASGTAVVLDERLLMLITSFVNGYFYLQFVIARLVCEDIMILNWQLLQETEQNVFAITKIYDIIDT